MMTLLPAIIRIALKELGRNRMRTAPAMTGIVIGIGAVFTMLSMGQSALPNAAPPVAYAGSNMAAVLTLSLASISFVGLFVGGTGVMNIMLVSVMERTKEIGIRMAVGAAAGKIQLQFLTESIVLSVAGGALGVFFGVIISRLIEDALGYPPFISAFAAGLAFSFSAAVGVGAGWYPARKAAALDPIETLRCE